MPPSVLLDSPYSKTSWTLGKIPTVKVRFRIRFPSGSSQEFVEGFWVDTGFDGGLKLSATFVDYLSKFKVSGWKRLVGTAGEAEIAMQYLIEVLEITSPTNVLRPPSPMETVLSCFKKPPNLLGLDVLKPWIAEFDGPKKNFRLSS